MLYLSNSSSFESVWKGRAPYLIFLWLLFLELALAWKKLPNKSLSITAIALTTAVPNYLIGISTFALDNEIMELGKLAGVPYKEHGEWIGYLHRDGSLALDLKGNYFKGPFHLPRQQLFCHLLLKEMLSKE